ncbi:helix-turn-helix transcriptional regulator [Microbacterium xylanilyticum]
MSTALTQERVRSDLDVLSRAGLTLDDFLAEAIRTLQRAVPSAAACVATMDPVSMMFTGGRKYGALLDQAPRDREFVQLEYEDDELSSFRSLALAGRLAVGMAEEVRDPSPRIEKLVRPVFGFSDESRMLFRDGHGVWGGVALFRDAGDHPYTADEIAYLATLSGAFARGTRSGVLTRLADAEIEEADRAPAVVIVDRQDRIAQVNLSAERRLVELARSGRERVGLDAHEIAAVDPTALVHALVAAARRMARTPDAPLPRSRVRTRSGAWLVLHASPLLGRDGDVGDVVVTIEEARPPEIIEIVVAAFGLTLRERDITRLVLQGVETKAIAASLHVSVYTVQDHLKAVFDKAGVRSRRELISRIYFDQYAPRTGAELTSSGWFAG